MRSRSKALDRVRTIGLLADQIRETGRTIFAGEDAIGRGALRARILGRAQFGRRAHLRAGMLIRAGRAAFGKIAVGKVAIGKSVAFGKLVGFAGAVGVRLFTSQTCSRAGPVQKHDPDAAAPERPPPRGRLSPGALGRRIAKVGGWTETRPVSLGLLPSGPDPVGEWCVHRQPPAPYLDRRRDFRNLFGHAACFDPLQKRKSLPGNFCPQADILRKSREGLS